MPRLHVSAIDIAIIAVYFIVTLGIGFVVRRKMKTGLDFLMSGRSVPAWISGLAFLSANLGAQEVIGMGASGAKYGMMTSHFYWVGAVPAMVFLAVFMMPLYYGSRARSVPEYLSLRFDEKTRAFNAGLFAVMTVLSSGISMYAMGKLLNLLLGLDVSLAIWVSAAVVLVYILLGGLTSAILNEVMQFFLIVFGFIPLVYLGLKDLGGWHAMTVALEPVATSQGFEPHALTHLWTNTGSASANPMGVEWFGLSMGLGFVLAFGYWCTDFLVVQRAMAAKSIKAAQRVPLIAAVPKMLFPFLVIVPGMIALALTQKGGSFALPMNADGSLDYNNATPMLLAHYFPAGLLGLGITALLASFMAGMAGNVTAFNTVWTYDLYQAYIKPDASDKHCLWIGRAATVVGILLSIATAYAASRFNNIMDFLQLVFAFVNAPLFGTFLLGMFWKRTTGHGAFVGLVGGTVGAAIHHGLTLPAGAVAGIKGGWITTLHHYPSEMAQNFWTAIFAFSTCIVLTVAVTLVTKPKSDAELVGLVRSLPMPGTEAVKDRRVFVYGLAILAAIAVLNIIFW
ncbi:MAG: sodium solute transporter superfamily [Caulobacteraceae bacterium]|nr:sodium solute transporter superfamily [Caulobacteraceae bacterium]